MKVTQISASLRYSKILDDGSWKAVEIGSEATLDAREDWQTAQSELYAQLGQQLKSLWASKNGSTNGHK